MQVGDTTARFGVSTRSERRRVRRLGGERFVLEAFLEDLTGTETVWDVGACVGTYACFAAQKLPEGRVIAFEPEPTNRVRLRVNLRANAPPERWQIVPAALSDRDGTATLASEFVEPGGGHHYLSDGAGRPVEARRGESIASRGYPSPDVLKLDVQGAELDALHGMGDALDGVDVIYAELHTRKSGRYGTTVEEVEEYLRKAGYSVEHLGEPTTGRPGVYFVRAYR
ncbi:FkbM family methyltransferase [Halorarum halophilum]|uniref:FkbM family methyltransferase n=1 Tax=Halorarum halophilum TaxID=2743090 RepID=A0A7D5L312_9EURY|nr:FkbM family methyltransferase [Halobaculum halophilum]